MVVQDTTSSASDMPRRARVRTSPREEHAWEEELPYWRDQLDGVTVPALPTDRSATPGTGSRATLTFDLPPGVSARLLELTDQQGVSLLDLSVAVVHVVMARYAGSEDVAVATAVTHCDEPANVVVLRSRVTGSSSFLDFLSRVRDTVRAAFAHSNAPFMYVAEKLGLPGDLARAVVVCGRTAVPPTADLAVRLVKGDAGLTGTVEYRDGLFDPVTVERLQHWRTQANIPG
jgi:hypothetical protein